MIRIWHQPLNISLELFGDKEALDRHFAYEKSDAIERCKPAELIGEMHVAVDPVPVDGWMKVALYGAFKMPLQCGKKKVS